MPDEKFTRCPSCRTVFRVLQAQLEIRAGQVRCGHCHSVFDGVANRVELAPPAEGAHEHNPPSEAALGPPTVTLRSAQALAPLAADSLPAGGAVTVSLPAANGTVVPVEPGDGPAEAATADGSGADSPPHRWRALAGLAILLLCIVLVGQAAFHFRDALAARWPASAPLLAQACAIAGCTVGPPREIAELSIQASDLQADPAHKGLLVLTATVRNRSARVLAYPFVELSLTDAQDPVVVRRAFAPAEYAGGTADLAAGIPGNAELVIKLFIDASATTQAGYRLYLFYI